MNNLIEISSATVKRLLKDIKDIKKNNLDKNGIYYKHSEDDMLLAYALIIGPNNTPYENGYYLFTIKYPCNYPYSPPTFKYCTNDGSTRFNPNLYIDGKVCLSILNTWAGEQWSACQSISSILLTLCTVLNDKPLLNEPGIYENHKDFSKYNEIITYKNFDFAICNYFEDENYFLKFECFKSIIYENFLNNYNNIIDNLKKNYSNNKYVHISIYNFRNILDYNNLLKRLENINFSLKN